MNRPQAKTWLASLSTAEIQERILQVSKEPETRHREKQLLALFGRLFELNGKVAAGLWLRIEADCQPDLKGEIARWASRSPEEAIAWFSTSVDQLRRYRAGFLVVDLAGDIIKVVTERDRELGVRLLMENPAFYDYGCFFSVGLELSVVHDADLLKTVVTWAARQGDDPGNSIRTLSGTRIDAADWGIQFLSRVDKDAALRLHEELPPGDPRRESWRDGIMSGWSETDRTAAMSWWVETRPPGKAWGEGALMPLMDWARDEPDEWLPWMEKHLPEEAADRAMVMAIDRTSPPSLMHLRLCAAIRSDELREQMAELIRSKGDVEKLRETAKGRPELEVLLTEDGR